MSVVTKKSPDKTDVFVGRRVRLARQLQNWTQQQLGAALGLTFQQVQKYEKGANRIGSSRLAKIAELLDRPVSWFFDEATDRPEEHHLITAMLTATGGLRLARAFVALQDRRLSSGFVETVEAAAAATNRDYAREAA